MNDDYRDPNDPNRGEANVRHRIELPQPLHHHLADRAGGDFGFAHRFDLALDARNQLVEPFLRDPPLAAGQRDR